VRESMRVRQIPVALIDSTCGGSGSASATSGRGCPSRVAVGEAGLPPLPAGGGFRSTSSEKITVEIGANFVK
jgi:hypothetical protein